MFLDKQNSFCEDLVISGSAQTVNSTNVIDMGNADAGGNENAELWVQLTEKFFDTSPASATLKIRLITADNASMTSYTVVIDTGALSQAGGTAGIAAGYQFPQFGRLPGTLDQYLQLRFTTTATAVTGKVSAGLTLDRQTA